MRHNSFALAAFAAASVPGFEPTRTVAIPTPQDDVDVAGVISEDHRRVLVTCPRSTAGGIRLEKELSLSAALSQARLGDLVPAVLGSVKLPEGGRAAVTETHDGAPLLFDRLAQDRDLAASLGEVLARIHSVPAHSVETVGAEVYSAQALRESHRAQMARTQQVQTLPTAVVQRWDALLADDALWDFRPVFIHGDLSEESLYFRDSRITGVRGWSSARIGDPADDLAWLSSALEPQAFDALFAAYRANRPGEVGPRLLERAQAVGEFAVMDWLLHGVEVEDSVIIDDARGMLADLESDISQLAKDEAEDAYRSLDTRPGRDGTVASAGSAAAAPSADGIDSGDSADQPEDLDPEDADDVDRIDSFEDPEGPENEEDPEDGDDRRF